MPVVAKTTSAASGNVCPASDRHICDPERTLRARILGCFARGRGYRAERQPILRMEIALTGASGTFTVIRSSEAPTGRSRARVTGGTGQDSRSTSQRLIELLGGESRSQDRGVAQ